MRKYYYTYEMNMVVLNLVCIILLIATVAIVYFLNGFAGFLNIGDGYLELNLDISMGLMFLIIIMWFILHEILHGIGFNLTKGIDKSKIVYGTAFEKGVLYCMCKDKISKKDIFRSLLFPLFFIGIVTLIIGMFTKSLILIFLSIFNISGACGDIMMALMVLRMPDDILYFDTDNMLGFTIISDEDLSQKKYTGFKLVKHGEYDTNDESLIAKDLQKIKISKPSYIVLIIILIISIVGMALNV